MREMMNTYESGLLTIMPQDRVIVCKTAVSADHRQMMHSWWQHFEFVIVPVQKKEAHERKQPLSQYTDSKYDATFMINAISDDDDDSKLIAGEAKKYLSIRLSYRSDEVSHCQICTYLKLTHI